MKQKCESIIKEQLQEIRSEHGMKEYLIMLARFPQMGYENVLLLMYLFPEATMVCGKGAWKNYQADIKAGERAIPLLCPLGAVGDMTKVSYGVVGVFDISQVQNRETIHYIALFYPVPKNSQNTVLIQSEDTRKILLQIQLLPLS